MQQPLITFQKLVLDPSQPEVNSVLLTIYAETKGLVDGFREIHSRITEKAGHLKLIAQPNNDSTELLYKAQDAEKVGAIGFHDLFIIEFEPQLTTDTLAIQIIINSKEAAEAFWPTAAAWLRITLQDWIASLQQNILLGYTLVYRANMLEEDVAVSDLLSPSVLNSLSTIKSEQSLGRNSTIKTMLIPDQGLLYLVDIPNQDSQALVYVALGIKGRNLDIATRTLAGRRGIITNIDVFVHKSYIQWLSLEKYREPYENKLKILNHHVTQLLTEVGKPRSSQADLLKIADDYSNLEKIFWEIERMELSLQQSIHGIERLFYHEEVNEIAAVHLRGMRQRVEEIRYLINKSRLTVDTTQTALQMMEAQQRKLANEQREEANQQRRLGDERQQHFNAFFVFLGIVLTLMQVLDDKLMEELLTNEALLQQYTICTPSTLIKIITRLIASLSLGLLIWIIVNTLIKRKNI